MGKHHKHKSSDKSSDKSSNDNLDEYRMVCDGQCKHKCDNVAHLIKNGRGKTDKMRTKLSKCDPYAKGLANSCHNTCGKGRFVLFPPTLYIVNPNIPCSTNFPGSLKQS